MPNNPDITPLTVAELFTQGHYFIPIYQRNYAWGEPEVRQLLQDILDESRRAKNSRHPASQYYIGSLVVDKRGEGQFETIDGQQRHTTLCVVLSALKNEFADSINQQSCLNVKATEDTPFQKLSSLSLNLSFTNRKRSTSTLALLAQGITTGCEQASMHGAYDVAVRFFEEHKQELCTLTDYLLNNVVILRVAVPKGTDLNHYFEIMNNRGEQLEKHEVLKARLMRPLGIDERKVFSTIWDACASMDRYAQLGFEKSLRCTLFGANWDQHPVDFESIRQEMVNSDSPAPLVSLEEIVQHPVLQDKKENPVNDDSEQYASIISFPNFLLHVLRITHVSHIDTDVPLDDKRLLLAFERFSNRTDEDIATFSREFVMNLLRCRLLFDRYIIKRKNDLDWSLEQLKPNETRHHYVSSGGDFNQQLIMQLSMFHVSFPTQVYKHWLSAVLYYLLKQHQLGEFRISQYPAFLDQLSNKFFYGRFGKQPIEYFDICFEDVMPENDFDHHNLKLGTHIQNFIFNRLDYRLWRKLKDGHEFDVDMDFVKSFLDKFRFTFRTSVEHYFPQHPIAGEPMDESILHSFGNLCLISHSDNSKFSNNDPATKKNQVKDKLNREQLAESLKLVFMMSYEHWDPENQPAMIQHEKMMVDVLCS